MQLFDSAQTKMAYDKFNILTSTAAPLFYRKCDMDKLFLPFPKATERVGFGRQTLRDWRQ
jgi:hypothetical protein